MTDERTNPTIQSTEAPAPKATATATAPAGQQPYYWGTGRRKTAVARVRIRPGEGSYVVNGRKPDEYFPVERDRKSIVAPLAATGTLGKMDVIVNVKGGGLTGQAGAILLGVARALRAANPDFEEMLRSAGHLTRDSRMVERKKYGQSGARRRFQFSKR